MINNSVMLYVDIFKSVSDPQNMAFKVTSLLKIVLHLRQNNQNSEA